MYLWNRREFLETSAMGLATLATGQLGWQAPTRARVSLVTVAAGGRPVAIRRAVDLIGAPQLSGKHVTLKPNFNSAHPFPGSTHRETLEALVGLMRDGGATHITVADRSGMGDSREVMKEKGIFDSAKRLGFDAVPLQDLPAEDWIHVTHPDLHWSRGFHLARVFRESEAIVQTCCLKTHRFGGHFTLSLKNTVGMAAKRVPGIDHDFMRELHRSPHQRRMIAELNLAYAPALVVMDAVDCFTDRGPEAGTVSHPNVILASTDRVALDAVGVAILRERGTTKQVSEGPIYRLEQIARAVDLGIGVAAANRIDIVTGDPEGERYRGTIEPILRAA